MKIFRAFLYVGVLAVALFAAEYLLKEVLLMYQNDQLRGNRSALELLEKEALQGNQNAAFLLATAYHNGKAGEVNRAKAIHWYKVSANNGDADAMLMLGWIYYKQPDNLAVNLRKARYWFRRSAGKGVEEAVEMLELLGK